MEQMKLECHFVNGTEHVQFVWRLIYNRQEILRFDSHVGKFVALTELGRPIAELMNSLLEALEQARAQVARCKDNYRLLKSFWMQRKGEWKQQEGRGKGRGEEGWRKERSGEARGWKEGRERGGEGREAG